MADLPTAIRALLLADEDIAAIVGTRIYPMIRPQGSTLPAIRLQFPSNIPDRDLKGEDGLTIARVQVDAFALTFGASWQLATKARQAFLAPATIAGVSFAGATAEGPVPEPGEDTPAGHIYWARVDLFVAYRLD